MFNSINHSISFTSKIKFISDDEFANVVADQPKSRSNPNYIGDPWDKTICSKKGFTDDAAGCIAGGLTNNISKDVVMFHYKPYNQKENLFEKIKNKIFENLGKMGAYTEKLGGLIIGGKIAASGDYNHKESMSLSEKFKQLFKDVNADFSVFVGQKSPWGITNACYWGDEDTWFINYRDNSTYGEKRSIKTPEDIKNAYFYREISDNDQVFIGNEEINKEDLKTSKNENQYMSNRYNNEPDKEQMARMAEVYKNYFEKHK